MPIVTITHGTETWSVKFKRSFYIVEDFDSKQLFWDSDGNNQKAGIIRIWVQYGDTDPRISFILPNWRITVDSIPLEQRFYTDEDENIQNLKGKKVLLSQGDWNFDFDFTDIQH